MSWRPWPLRGHARPEGALGPLMDEAGCALCAPLKINRVPYGHWDRSLTTGSIKVTNVPYGHTLGNAVSKRRHKVIKDGAREARPLEVKDGQIVGAQHDALRAGRQHCAQRVSRRPLWGPLILTCLPFLRSL